MPIVPKKKEKKFSITEIAELIDALDPMHPDVPFLCFMQSSLIKYQEVHPKAVERLKHLMVKHQKEGTVPDMPTY